MGQIEKIWSGNWQRRVYDKLERIGFSQVSDYLAARPGATYAQLAEELGDDTAPVQITRLHLLEAKRAGQLRDGARDALVRYVRERLPSGWGRKPPNEEQYEQDFLNASAWSGWSRELEEAAPAEFSAFADAIWEQLSRSAPEGWLPVNTSDKTVVAIFDAAWPRK